MPQGPSGSKKAVDTFNALRRRIMTGEWPINSRIPREPELMELLGVGKSTVREAVRSLANLGMLETVRGVGTFVRSRVPASDVFHEQLLGYPLAEVLDYRSALEIEAAQRAAARRSPEQLARLRAALDRDIAAGPQVPQTPERGRTPGSFHHLLVEAAGVSLLTDVYTAVMSTIRLAAIRGDVVHGAPRELRLRDHELIFRAIEAQDIAGAAHVTALHVDNDLVLGTGECGFEARASLLRAAGVGSPG
ncbi:MAG TPA: FCD domain-containing protein [Cellulomonas sp.]